MARSPRGSQNASDPMATWSRWISTCRSSTWKAPDLELRVGDIVAAPVDPGTFDLVTARAVLHHVTDADAAIRNLVAGLAPGGGILLIEPDFLPVSVAEPPDVRAFWDGWLAWSRDQGIDYHIGRTLAPRLAAAGLEQVAGTAETAVYQGGSSWALLLDGDDHRASRSTRWLGKG